MTQSYSWSNVCNYCKPSRVDFASLLAICFLPHSSPFVAFDCVGMSADPKPKQFDPFEEGPLTVEQRFADNPKGRARQDRVWKLYVQQGNVSCPLFDESGTLL